MGSNWKLGLVGRNGRGKTTLLRLLAGELEGRGTVSLEGVSCLRWPMRVDDPSRRALDILLEGAPPGEEWRLSWELSKLGLEESVLDRPFATLSGGEQTRALLAALFLDEGAYPMIDEPTNHLDIATIEWLEGYLKRSKATLMMVTHDRYFLDNIVDHLFVLEGNGVVKDFPGNYSDYRKWQQDMATQNANEKAKITEKTKKNGTGKDKADRPAKLSFKERKELEELTVEIDELSTEKAMLEAAFASGEQLTDIEAKSLRYNQLKDLLDIKELRWLELSEKQ